MVRKILSGMFIVLFCNLSVCTGSFFGGKKEINTYNQDEVSYEEKEEEEKDYDILVASTLKANPLSPQDGIFLKTALPNCTDPFRNSLIETFFDKKEVGKLLLFQKEALEKALDFFQNKNNQLAFSWVLENIDFSKNEKSKLLLKALLAKKDIFINLFDEEAQLQVISDNFENSLVFGYFSKELIQKSFLKNREDLRKKIQIKVQCIVCYELMTSDRKPTLTGGGNTYCNECLLACYRDTGEDPLNRDKLDLNKFMLNRDLQNEADEYVARYGAD